MSERSISIDFVHLDTSDYLYRRKRFIVMCFDLIQISRLEYF